MIKILFVLKYRGTYTNEYNSYTNEYSEGYISSGLYNSARMMAAAFEEFGIYGEEVDAKIVQLNSYNLIDAEVVSFNPDIVIIEALWVPPSKVKELAGLWRHRNRKWIVRNHSEIPFLTLERNSLTWIPQYLTGSPNIFTASNSTTSLIDIREIVAEANGWPIEQANERVVFIPNYYLIEREPSWVAPPLSKSHVDVSCFGALRSLKNHTEQAVAAIRWARLRNKPLRFHINAGRVEMGADNVLNNLRAIFNGAGSAELVEHGWLDHDNFLDLIATMDVSMQVSFSETFNIVTADAVSCGVPVVVSNEIGWINDSFKCLTGFSNDIVNALERARTAGERGLQLANLDNLKHYNRTAYLALEENIDTVLRKAINTALLL